MSDKLAEMANELAKLRAKIAAHEVKIAPLKKQADDLEDQLRVGLIESGTESIATKAYTFSLKRSQIAVLDDADAFFKYVAKNKAFDLLRRQPVIEACRARWDDKLTIPGVHADTRVSLSATARKGKK